MENLFYGRKMAQVFDLKGSLRNRNVKTEQGKESCEVVLLDENLLKLVHDNPLYIRSHCKAILRAAIHSDAYFLSSHLIIDYSLLVGRDDATDQLVVGIIGKALVRGAVHNSNPVHFLLNAANCSLLLQIAPSFCACAKKCFFPDWKKT